MLYSYMKYGSIYRHFIKSVYWLLTSCILLHYFILDLGWVVLHQQTDHLGTSSGPECIGTGLGSVSSYVGTGHRPWVPWFDVWSLCEPIIETS